MNTEMRLDPHVYIEIMDSERAIKKAELDLLNWFMKLCGSGMTTGMIRKVVHNKYVERSGRARMNDSQEAKEWEMGVLRFILRGGIIL